MQVFGLFTSWGRRILVFQLSGFLIVQRNTNSSSYHSHSESSNHSNRNHGDSNIRARGGLASLGTRLHKLSGEDTADVKVLRVGLKGFLRVLRWIFWVDGCRIFCLIWVGSSYIYICTHVYLHMDDNMKLRPIRGI